MVLHLRLEPKQTQRIVITPQLRQAIKLLQLSAIELQSYIENEVRDNPLLSVEETPEAGFEDGDSSPVASANGGVDVPAFDARDSSEAEFSGDWDHEPDGEITVSAPSEIPANGSDWLNAGRSQHTFDGEEYDPLASISPEVTLAGHLREQAQLAFASPHDRFIADYLIDLVDAGGYLRGSLEEIAALLSIDLSTVERVLATLQTFDPPGVCARTLAECLALQLKERNRFDPCMERMLAHLDLVAACDFQRLKKLCGVDADDISEMLAEIRQLNPRPGLAFEKVEVPTLVPDVIVKRAKDGTWRAELNPVAAPSLAVDRAYYAALKTRCRSGTDRNYLTERLSAANWLVKSLDQRLSTILKVATAVVEEQSAFFDHGVRHLKPLNLRQIAAKIGMHESTVSRVTSNKAIATPRGLFEMKYFFTSAIAAAVPNQSHSSEAVRDRIKEFIYNESPECVLSDDRIVSLLRADGIEIARRTVAKYRESLRIPSSAARRRQKRARKAA
jgi:RNA polymerase sigma-54 factor